MIGQVILANNRVHDFDYLATIIAINGDQYTVRDQEDDVFDINETEIMEWNPI